MSDAAVMKDPCALEFDNFKAKRMCERGVEDEPQTIEFVPDHFKAQEMCDKTAEEDPCALEFVRDWFVTHQQVKIGHDDDGYDGYDEIIEWYNGYQKRKAQKAQIKKEIT